MPCHVCGLEAIERCYTCGKLFCAQHGKMNCIRCETGFMPGDRRADRISADRNRAVTLGASARPGWWRPQPADDFEPPACYQCRGLARRRCRNCGNLMCADHAAKGGLCRECENSARIGIFTLLALFVGLIALIVMSYSQSAL
ncbi:MAG: hypothetical protein HY040_05095 [Planctomycetes bacterium]|nr:hypothetical protein [Planctomycetota bacterium]